MDLPPLVVSLTDQISGPAKSAASSLEMMGGSAADLAGPLGIAVSVVAGVATALVGATAALSAFAIEATEARAKIEGTFSALAGGAAGADKAIATMDALGASTGMTRAQLAPMAEQLLAMGVPLNALKGQLTALATVQALGMNGTATYTEILKKLNEHIPISTRSLAQFSTMGISVADVAGRMGLSVQALELQLKKGTVNATAFQNALEAAVTAKGADALAAQANSLSSQMALFKENIMHLFEGVDTGPFLAGLKSVLQLFSQDTASGRAMKMMITGAFDAIFKVASYVWPWIKTAIELVVIAALKMYIAFKPVIAAFKQLVTDGGPSIDFLKFFKMELGGFVMMAQRVANAIMFVIKAVVFLENTFKHAKDAAKELITGLVNGITGGAGLVWDAIKNLGTGAMNALKGVLGIHSPSTVFAGFGHNIGLGLAQGIDGSAPHVAGAATRLGGAAAIKPASIAGGGAAGGARGVAGKSGNTIHVNFAAGSVVVNGANARSAEELSQHTMAMAFEKLSLAAGLG